MKIVNSRPPNFEKVAAAFKGAHSPGVIFCYGDTIYHPGGGPLSASLIAHENVHSARQGKDPEGWWDRYIADPQFRFIEELLAHRIEYAVASKGMTRNQRRQCLRPIARRLSSSLYGGLVSPDQAKLLILHADVEAEAA